MSIPSPVHFIEWASAVWETSAVSKVFDNGTTKVNKFFPREYDVDPKTGFFPSQPLPKLPKEFEHWEQALEEAGRVLTLGEDQGAEAVMKRPDGERWRETVRSWPVKSTVRLGGNLPLLQRAHLVLASIMHFYVHSIPPTNSQAPVVVPKCIAVPLVAVSRELKMAPVLTFADTVLWNWDLIDPALPLSVDNMRYINIFSGTEAERNFYLKSAAVELKGVEMLDIFEEFMNLRSITDPYATAKITRDLTRLAKIVDELTSILTSMRAAIDPHVFYWQVRKWWSGATSKGSAPGWILEGVPETLQHDLGGASAGQSSVMHALDIFLDVDHKLRENRTPAPSDHHRKADRGFMERMRRYMPGLHRGYLENLRSVREAVERTPSLKPAYNAAVMALKNLRDSHIRIVAIYVISKANSTPPPQLQSRDPNESDQKDGRSIGTGGSEVSNLLKAGRDATQRALLN